MKHDFMVESIDNVTIGEVVGFLADNRDVLLSHPLLVQWYESKGPFLMSTLPCGETKVFWTRENVPSTSVPCLCGKVSYPHYFIKYRENHAN